MANYEEYLKQMQIKKEERSINEKGGGNFRLQGFPKHYKIGNSNYNASACNYFYN